jgi:hypothetical protein
LAVGVPFDGEVEPKPDAEEPSEPAPDAVDPATPDELPPADKPLPDVFRPEWPPPHDEEDEETDEPAENGIFGSGVAGLARESTNTSPRMCSTNWAGTPGGLTGWVNTMCTPVAVTVSSPALFVPGPGPNWKVEFGEVASVDEVVVD